MKKKIKIDFLDSFAGFLALGHISVRFYNKGPCYRHGVKTIR